LWNADFFRLVKVTFMFAEMVGFDYSCRLCCALTIKNWISGKHHRANC